MWALYRIYLKCGISAVLIGIATWHMLGFFNWIYLSNGLETLWRELFYCALVGWIVTGLLVWITEYYTSTEYRPVKTVAKSSETGDGTNVIQGLAISMEACYTRNNNFCGHISIIHLGWHLWSRDRATTMLALADGGCARRLRPGNR